MSAFYDTETNRTNTPFFFEGDVSRDEFNAIVYRVAEQFNDIVDIKVDGPIVRCRVLPTGYKIGWSFELDFNDYGRLTGAWWSSSEDYDSSIPRTMADRIGHEIVNYDPQKNIDNLPSITLLHRICEDGSLSLKVSSQHNAKYTWQRLQFTKSQWETIQESDGNQITVDSVVPGDKYRCIITINNRAAYRSSEYMIGSEKKRENETEQESYKSTNSKASSADAGFTFFKGCSTWEQVKSRYKKLMQTYHPDIEAGDEEISKIINAQYEEEKRKYRI